MSHPNERAVAKVIDNPNYGMREKLSLVEKRCNVCSNSKNCKAPANDIINDQNKKTTIHVDLCGPVPLQTGGGREMIWNMVTTQHHLVWRQALEDKDQVTKYVLEFVQWLGRSLEYPARRGHVDNAKEFLVMERTL